MIQSSFRCECVGWKTCTLRRNLSSSSYVPGVSPADMICPYCKKTDYLSALYMQHGSKPQESLSPAALYSHDDRWGKGKGGAVRRKKYSETGHNSNKTVEKWAQKQQRVAAAGCKMSGIGRRGQWCRGRYGAVSATAEDTHDKFPRPHHNEGKDYADGEDKGWRDAQRGVDKGVLNHGVVHYEVVVCLVSLMA